MVTPTHIDLACGQKKRDGYYGVDIADVDGVDLVHDLSVFPWPLETGSAESVYCAHYVEHTYPVGGQQDGLIMFMNEVHRICQPGGVVEITHPYALSSRAFQDPTHTRFIPEATWWYFNAEWREANGLSHYPITADFEPPVIVNGFQNGWDLRSQQAQAFAAAHYWNVVADLGVQLVAKK